MSDETRPTVPVVASLKQYDLYANGELWTRGEHGFRAGYVMDAENLDTAIVNHEEEMRVLLAQAREEFGL